MIPRPALVGVGLEVLHRAVFPPYGEPFLGEEERIAATVPGALPVSGMQLAAHIARVQRGRESSAAVASEGAHVFTGHDNGPLAVLLFAFEPDYLFGHDSLPLPGLFLCLDLLYC